MAGKSQEEGRREQEVGSIRSVLDLIEYIQEIARFNAQAKLNTEHQLELYLKSWWSRHYNRPLKDPVLQSYTLEELIYEFYDKIERERAKEEAAEQEADKIEDEREQANLDWAEEEERKEREAMEAKAKAEQGVIDPTDLETAQSIINDPDNQKWIEEQLAKELEEQGKNLFGENFGEDIDEDFDG